jgi:hypothetical protein
MAIARMEARMDDNDDDDYTNDNDRQPICSQQVRNFKANFQNLNVPCLITGLDRSPHFSFLNRQWRRHVDGKKPLSSDRGTASRINRSWFRDELGEDSLVPLRYNPRGGGDSLDEDGRATECETKEVAMKEWIHMLEATVAENTVKENQYSSKEQDRPLCDSWGLNAANDEELNTTIYYLKDWHLQQRYSSTRTSLNSEDHPFGAAHCTPPCSLYSTPECFGHDLLNAFLTRFTTGDYRFCYWGPPRSFTARHSDVMHSFSWSYNVVGTKKWTFYPPNEFSRCEAFSIVQETGQTIFVPATWQHKVLNLEETISINHNWITSANLDLVWDCLVVEMAAIRSELEGWGESGDDENGLDQNAEACENMLRGCLGLDMTGFVLMALVGLLEATTELVSMQPPDEETGPSSGNSRVLLANRHEELVFDALRLASVLRGVFATGDDTLQIGSRLDAVLQCEAMAQSVERMVTHMIDWVLLD